MKRVVSILLLLIMTVGMAAQTTKIRGHVTDVETGEPIPFAGVYFEGTTTGLTADGDGFFFLETRDTTVKKLSCQILGYEPQSIPVKHGVLSNVNFRLRRTDNRLSEVVVKADNSRIRKLLRAIDARRSINDPERRRAYQCDMYNKMEIDLTHAEEQLSGLKFGQDMGFIFDYMDTSSVSGVPYLPVLLSETVAKRYHTSDPDMDNEVIEANRISGVNPDNNLLTQFTGTMHIKVNFYDDFIKIFNLEFPSPIKSNGLMYYNYFIIDSLQVDGRKTLVVRYHPKKMVSSPVFDGEMRIDAEDYAVRSVHAVMQKGLDVNWLRDAVADVEYTRLPDGTWFYKQDKLYADFSVTMSETSRMMSLLGTRELTYSNPTFDESVAVEAEKGMVHIEKGANHKEDGYWDARRPLPLSGKELGIYEMVDRVERTKTYKTLYTLIETLVVAYYDIGKISIGPYHKLFSYNNFEGFRTQLGVRTSYDVSTSWRVGGYAAYGFMDRTFKGGALYELMISREPTRKFTAEATYDVFQLGKGSNEFTGGNILSSLSRSAQKPCMRLNLQSSYEHEFNPNFTLAADIAARRYYANYLVPMTSLSGNAIPSIATNDIHLKARFSKDETVNRGYFVKKSVYSYYPIVSVDLYGGIPGLRENDFGYFRPEISVDWRVKLPPMGTSRIRANAGTIIGQVPYPLLHMPEGNSSYVLDKTAFSCMDFFEFATDSWFTLFWNHEFGGLLLDKIPLIKELKLREEFTFKMAYGTLSDRNNALLPGSTAPMAFPEGMTTMGGKPYIEVGAGLSNILQLFRVDCFWRLTHRQKEINGELVDANHLFAVNVGFELRF